MNEDIKKSKLERFIIDEEMSMAVYDVLLQAFLGKKGQRDVQTLAAERLAVDLLKDAWRELSNYKVDKDSSPQKLKQVGL